MKKDRIYYYDFLKGLAIMGVVAIHTMILNFEPYSFEGGVFAVFRNLLGCCVPFFVTVSGYFLAPKEVSTKCAYINFIKTRFKTVYIPMLIWGLPWLCLLLLSVQTFSGACYVLGMYLIGGVSILYFIALIIELYLQLPIIQKVNVGGMIFLSIISLVVTYGWSLVNYTTDIHPPLVAYCSFPTYIGFFALGCYIGKTKMKPNVWFSLIIVILGLTLSVLESYYWLDYNPKNNWLGLKSSVQFLSLGIILLLFTKELSGCYRSNKITRIIETFGTQSMPIYMSHMLVKFALNKIGFNPDMWITNWGVVFMLDVIFIFTLAKVLPKKYLPYIGIR